MIHWSKETSQVITLPIRCSASCIRVALTSKIMKLNSDHLQAVGVTWQRTPAFVTHQGECRCKGMYKISNTTTTVICTILIIFSFNSLLPLSWNWGRSSFTCYSRLYRSYSKHWRVSHLFFYFNTTVCLFPLFSKRSMSNKHVCFFPRWWKIGWWK